MPYQKIFPDSMESTYSPELIETIERTADVTERHFCRERDAWKHHNHLSKRKLALLIHRCYFFSINNWLLKICTCPLHHDVFSDSS